MGAGHQADPTMLVSGLHHYNKAWSSIKYLNMLQEGDTDIRDNLVLAAEFEAYICGNQ
jgi:hypothetical protein